MVGFTNIKVKADFGGCEVQETSPRWFFQAVK
jgi:methyltransferase